MLTLFINPGQITEHTPKTNIDDYWLSYHVGDDVENVYFAPLLCKFICNALGQQEAWICFEDRLENSDDAPRELNAWFEYAEKVGIRDVTLYRLLS